RHRAQIRPSPGLSQPAQSAGKTRSTNAKKSTTPPSTRASAGAPASQSAKNGEVGVPQLLLEPLPQDTAWDSESNGLIRRAPSLVTYMTAFFDKESMGLYG